MSDVEFDNILSRFLDGHLTVEEDRWLAAQIRENPDCERRLIEEVETAGLLRQLPVADGEFLRALQERFRADGLPGLFVDEVTRRASVETDGILVGQTSDRVTGRGKVLRGLAPVLSAAAALLLAVGAWLWLGGGGAPLLPEGRGTGIARVTDVVNGNWQMAGGAGGSLRTGDVVREGTRIEIGAGGHAKLAWLGQTTSLDIEGGSSLDTRDFGFVHLERGRLTATVTKQDMARPFVIETPLAIATVLGTRFMISADPEATHVEVEEGRVQMTARSSDHKALVWAGLVGKVRRGDPTPQVTGKILLDDDFQTDLSNWRVRHSIGEHETVRLVDPAFLSRVRLEDRTDGRPGRWLVIDATGMGENEWVVLESRKRFAASCMKATMNHLCQKVDKSVSPEFTLNIFSDGGRAVQQKRYPASGMVGLLLSAETEWIQRPTEGGWETYRRSTWGGGPLFEQTRAYAQIGPVSPSVIVNVKGCVFIIDRIVLRTQEPIPVPSIQGRTVIDETFKSGLRKWKVFQLQPVDSTRVKVHPADKETLSRITFEDREGGSGRRLVVDARGMKDGASILLENQTPLSGEALEVTFGSACRAVGAGGLAGLRGSLYAEGGQTLEESDTSGGRPVGGRMLNRLQWVQRSLPSGVETSSRAFAEETVYRVDRELHPGKRMLTPFLRLDVVNACVAVDELQVRAVERLPGTNDPSASIGE